MGIELSVSIGSDLEGNMAAELQQILDDLGLGDRIRVELDSDPRRPPLKSADAIVRWTEGRP